MTKEELSKLNNIESDINHIRFALDRFMNTRPNAEEVYPKTSSSDIRLETKRVPGLSDAIRNTTIEYLAERLDELENQMNSIVLCTQAVGGPVYTPTNLTNDSK